MGKTEKPFFKYSRFWKQLLFGISIGWLLRGYFPEQTFKSIIINFGGHFFGTALPYLVDTINGLGGLPVIIAAIIAIINLRKKNK